MALTVGVLSKIPNLFNEIKLKLPKEIILKELISASTDGPKDIQACEVIVADYDLLGPYVYELDNVKFVQGTWAGIDALLPHLKPDVKPTTPILRFSGIHFGKIISEYVIAAIVNHERDAFKIRDNQMKRTWSQEGRIHDYRTIFDLTIGVMGAGQIGSKLMSTLKMLGANIRALGRRTNIDLKKCDYIDEYYPSTKLNEFLPNCDYLINTLPNTTETKGLLNNDVLKICKDLSPVFINVGRGTVISDDSLINALENNWLSFAYLDVFNQEPLPQSNLLWNPTKVSITPHVAACSRPRDIADQFAENLNLFLANKPLPTQIDFSRGY